MQEPHHKPALAIATLFLLASTIIYSAPVHAQGYLQRGANGALGRFARAGKYGNVAGRGGVLYGQGAAGMAHGNWAGPNGGKLAGAGGGFLGKNAGLAGGAFHGMGPNGGTANGAGGFGYKRGVGAFEGSNTNLHAANGSTYNGYSRGAYNAQTGQGSFNSGKQGYNAQTGQTAGYTDQTAYQNGQGMQSNINADNHGDYSVDWQKGQRPVVTQTSTTGAPVSSMPPGQ